jgi:serine/threonine protein kinase
MMDTTVIGSTLSHYRLLEKLGAGDMGEVFRAEDSRLNRQVAIKVLPDVFAGDPERLARFEREAKLLASKLFAFTESCRHQEISGADAHS